MANPAMRDASGKPEMLETHTRKIFVQACLPNAGLANRLFPWARALVYARNNKLRMLPTRWGQMKVGPLLRGERDLRLYANQFRGNAQDLNWFKAMWARSTYPILEEGADIRKIRRALIIFRGMGDYFRPLLPWSDLIVSELRCIASERVGRLIEDQAESLPAIGIHVRTGDFRQPSCLQEFHTSGSIRTPLVWFVEALTALREFMGKQVPAFVVSDAQDSELAPLIGLPSVSRRNTHTALGDLLLLSRSSLILGSGGSSFSAWASFLAQAPVLTIEGQSLTWFGLNHLSEDNQNQPSSLAATLPFQPTTADLGRAFNKHGLAWEKIILG